LDGLFKKGIYSKGKTHIKGELIMSDMIDIHDLT